MAVGILTCLKATETAGFHLGCEVVPYFEMQQKQHLGTHRPLLAAREMITEPFLEIPDLLAEQSSTTDVTQIMGSVI